jgi:hypothetical protein
MTSAEWRPIAEFPGYWISSAGHGARGRLELARVCMRRDGKKYFRPIHLLRLDDLARQS